MSRTTKPRPTMPPIKPPIIAGVLFDPLFGAGVGFVEEVGTRFPTVESGTFANAIASVGENESAVTTLRYAHAGTAVDGLI